ncbi:hypothetical protein WAI453_009116 [Rhynchosporium graminicola]
MGGRKSGALSGSGPAGEGGAAACSTTLTATCCIQYFSVYHRTCPSSPKSVQGPTVGVSN